MQSAADDDVRKRLSEKPRFELAAKSVFSLERCYIFRLSMCEMIWYTIDAGDAIFGHVGVARLNGDVPSIKTVAYFMPESTRCCFVVRFPRRRPDTPAWVHGG